jgi:lipopolysaccharide/colanic/teichoic acid biosynthesis glycosyltransferase
MTLKRIFDLFFSLTGLVVLLPVFIIITLVIKAQRNGPVFFRQTRAGQGGKPFKILKFRSMIIHEHRMTVTVKGDNRITKVGAVLRKYKLDELPELLNVIKGDMSFVGPRPDIPEYSDRLTGNERVILNLKPGITGPATIKYRNEEELLSTVSDPEKYNDNVIWPDKVKINLDYYHNRNFQVDMYIIFKTISSLFK